MQMEIFVHEFADVFRSPHVFAWGPLQMTDLLSVMVICLRVLIQTNQGTLH